MFKFCVIEIERKASDIILIGPANVAKVKPVWNILFHTPYESDSDEDTTTAFDACVMWLEQNKVEGSKYVITELYFYE